MNVETERLRRRTMPSEDASEEAVCLMKAPPLRVSGRPRDVSAVSAEGFRFVLVDV